MTKRLLLFLCVIASLNVNAGNKILYYFNRPVDNSVSTGVNAVYSTNIADTLVAYISRSKYTIDIAQYDYNQSGSYANIATAINAAFARGVQVRWIYDGSSSNTGLTALNASIHTLGSPTSGSYGIMHNKFVVIDAGSSDPGDAVVWTGSFDWSSEQFGTDYNNAVVLQDSALAHAFTDQFNMMWGGTGTAPDLSTNKFGPDKTDLGRHSFTIDGNQVELYFSPADGTNTHIQTAISSANVDLYFGMYTFTDYTDANMIVAKHASGVYVAGINDSYSNSYSPHDIFTAGLGSNFIVYNSTGIYHNKFMIVDPSDACSDPLVLTGSHNWTASANTKNDENTLIIHNAAAANIYYQSFHANFTLFGGTLTPVSGCPTSVSANNTQTEEPSVYPNPSNGNITATYHLSSPEKVNVEIFNVLGQKVVSVVANELQQPGNYAYNTEIHASGMYFARFTIGANSYNRKLIIAKK